MVDALRRASRWLDPPGRLTHVVPRVELGTADGTVVPIGDLIGDDDRRLRHAAADLAVLAPVEHGFFGLEAEEQFAFFRYPSSPRVFENTSRPIGVTCGSVPTGAVGPQRKWKFHWQHPTPLVSYAPILIGPSLNHAEKETKVMTTRRAFGLVGVAGAALLALPGSTRAEDISGTVTRTLMLSENTRLVGDITCQVTGAPCIAFAAPNIVLALNGFAITGPNDPATGCKGTSVGTETGISTNAQNNVGVRGPGVVQRFQGDGILFMSTTRGWVQNVTTTTNCMSGIRVNPTSSQISVESNVSVRNGTAAAACGGI